MRSRSDIETECGLWMDSDYVFFLHNSESYTNNIPSKPSLCSHLVIFYLQPRVEHL